MLKWKLLVHIEMVLDCSQLGIFQKELFICRGCWFGYQFSNVEAFMRELFSYPPLFKPLSLMSV